MPRVLIPEADFEIRDADIIGGLRETVTVPETLAPFAGAVIVTVGGVVSSGVAGAVTVAMFDQGLGPAKPTARTR